MSDDIDKINKKLKYNFRNKMRLKITITILYGLALLCTAVDFENQLQERAIKLDYQSDQEIILNLEKISYENSSFVYEVINPVEGCSLLDAHVSGNIPLNVEAVFEENEYLHLREDHLFSISLMSSPGSARVRIFSLETPDSPRLALSITDQIQLQSEEVRAVLEIETTLLVVSSQDLLFYDMKNITALVFVNLVMLSNLPIKSAFIQEDCLIAILSNSLNAYTLTHNSASLRASITSISQSDKDLPISDVKQMVQCADTIYLVMQTQIIFLKYHSQSNTFEVLDQIDLGLEILELQIFQRAVIVLARDHIYEYLIYDNCTDLRENRIFILSQFPNDQKKGAYQLITSSNQAKSRFFGVYDQISKTIYIIQHSRNQSTAAYIFHSQRLQKSQEINQILLAQDLNYLSYATKTNIWLINLKYTPEALKCLSNLGRSVDVTIKASGLFCISYPYNFSGFRDSLVTNANISAPKYMYHDPYYYNPTKPCVRRLEIELTFPWSLFMLVLIGIGCVVVLGCLIFFVSIVRNNVHGGSQSIRFQDEPEVKVSIPKLDTQGSKEAEHLEGYNGRGQNNLIQKIEMTSTPTVTKRETGELSFGPDEEDLAKRIASFDQNRNPQTTDPSSP